MASTLAEHRGVVPKEYINTVDLGSGVVQTVNTLNPSGGNINITTGTGIGIVNAGSTITVSNLGVATINSQGPSGTNFLVQVDTDSGYSATSAAGSVTFDTDLTNAETSDTGGVSAATALSTGSWAIFPTGTGTAPTFTVGAGQGGLYSMSATATFIYQANAVPFKYMRLRWQNTTSGVTMAEQTWRDEAATTNGADVEVTLNVSCMDQLAVSDVVELQYRVETPPSGSYTNLDAGDHTEYAVLMYKG